MALPAVFCGYAGLRATLYSVLRTCVGLKTSYEQAAVQFFKSNTREFERYYSTTLIKQVSEEMLQSLPTVVAARLAFQRLVANGQLQRTDGIQARIAREVCYRPR
jgi:hypothetical protein